MRDLLSPCNTACLENRDRGFTLIELLVVLLLVAVLVGLAAPNLKSIAANQAVSSASSDLLSATISAKNLALSRNRRVIVQPLSGTWTSGWRVYVDNNTNATFDAGADELLLEREATPADVVTSSQAGACSNIDLIAYDPTGYLANVGGSYNGGVTFATSVTGRMRCLTVSRAGRARICDPATTGSC
jgi:type IV fimbrial biogenesis protein FimT